MTSTEIQSEDNCPNATNGQHDWQPTGSGSVEGRQYDDYECSLCGATKRDWR
jgi:hypothetical protein